MNKKIINFRSEIPDFSMYNAHPQVYVCYTWDYYSHYYAHGM